MLFLHLFLDTIVKKLNSLFGYVARLGSGTTAHQALWHQIDISLLDGFLTVHGNVLQIAQEVIRGWIRFALTTTSHLLISGDVLSIEVILG